MTQVIAKKRGRPPKIKPPVTVEAVATKPVVSKPANKAVGRPKKDNGNGTQFNPREQLVLLKDSLNKHFKGDGEILFASEFTNTYTLRRPTGITSLDLALAGGFPAGGLCQGTGKESVGKTFLANLAIAMIQRIYGEKSVIGLSMTESIYDKTFARKCGVRIAYSDDEIDMFERAIKRHYTNEELAYMRDQVGEFIYNALPTAEQVLEATAKILESNLCQFILVDSMGSLLTNAENEAKEGIEKRHYGGASGVITQFMHRVHAALRKKDPRGNANLTTIYAINQYRMNFNAAQGANPIQIAGGHGLKHGKLIDILQESGSKIFRDKANADYTVVGKEMKWEIIKGKAGTHDGIKGSYNFYFGEHGWPFGVDVYTDLIMTGVLHGVIQQAGAWFSYEGQRIGQGAANAARFLWENPKIFQQIKTQIFDKAGLIFLTHEDQGKPDDYSQNTQN